MAKQSAPIQEVSRLLDLVPYLSTHSYISLRELAQEFGVDEKAMANELTALSMCGLPGYTPYELIEIFFDTGFVTINNHEALDIPRALTNLEVAALLIGLEILKDATTPDDIEVIQKIEELLEQLRSLIGSAIEVEDNPISAHLATIQSAIANRSALEIEYLSPVKDEITIRTVDPLSIKVEAGFSYLVAYSRQQKSVRNFRLDRVQSLKKIDQSLPLDEVKEEATEQTIDVTFQVKGSRRAVAELLNLTSIPQNGEVTSQVYSSEWVIKAVAAHSPDLILTQPVGLKAEAKAYLADILALYAP